MFKLASGEQLASTTHSPLGQVQMREEYPFHATQARTVPPL